MWQQPPMPRPLWFHANLKPCAHFAQTLTPGSLRLRRREGNKQPGADSCPIDAATKSGRASTSDIQAHRLHEACQLVCTDAAAFGDPRVMIAGPGCAAAARKSQRATCFWHGPWWAEKRQAASEGWSTFLATLFSCELQTSTTDFGHIPTREGPSRRIAIVGVLGQRHLQKCGMLPSDAPPFPHGPIEGPKAYEVDTVSQ